VFVERLWRSVKYEEVHLRAYDSISAARQGLGRHLTVYNQNRPHRALDGHTPKQVYCDNLTTRLTAVSSEHREAPLKEWNILSKQLEPPLFAYSLDIVSSEKRANVVAAKVMYFLHKDGLIGHSRKSSNLALWGIVSILTWMSVE
jgi:hypothetical protein